MSSVKELLHNTIESMDDEDAIELLNFARRLKEKKDIWLVSERLTNNPNFKIPSDKSKGFKTIVPIQGKGIPASELLIKERR